MSINIKDLKAKFNRVAADNSQLQMFAYEMIDAIEELEQKPSGTKLYRHTIAISSSHTTTVEIYSTYDKAYTNEDFKADKATDIADIEYNILFVKTGSPQYILITGINYNGLYYYLELSIYFWDSSTFTRYVVDMSNMTSDTVSEL